MVIKKEITKMLGERVRYYRVASEMKQRDLASCIGVSYQQVQKYETGKDRMSIDTLYEISRVLMVPMLELLEGVGPTELPHNRHSLLMMEHFNRIKSVGSRQAILSLTKAIAAKENE